MLDSDIINFGNHKGQHACDVPIDYLVWASSAMQKPRPCIVVELKRRAERLGTRDAVEACAALSALRFRQARKAKPRNHRPWLSKKRYFPAGSRQSPNAKAF
jgi:hypothetical protein